MVAEPGSLLTFLAGITLVLVVAHALGALADRLGFAPVVGELLTGLVLGPAVLGVVAPGLTALLVPIPAGLVSLASLGLIFLLVLAGTEVDVATVRRFLGPTVALAAGAFVVPFGAGVALGWVLPARFLVDPAGRLPFALFLGTALSISAVPVAVRVLVDLDALDRPVGQLTLTAAVVIDAVGWLTLTLVADFAGSGQFEPTGLARTVAVLVAFVLVAVAVGPRVVDAVFDRTAHTRSPVLTGFATVVVLGVGLSAGAVALGLEAVLGAFIAGILVKRRLDAETEHVFQLATLGLFAPVFFATAGLRADLSGLFTPDALVVGGVTLAVAVGSKFVGVAVGAAFTDLSRAETRCLAIGLNARGAMEIVVAALGLRLGVLTPTVYAVIVGVAIVTSVMTPPLLRRALSRLPDPPVPSTA